MRFFQGVLNAKGYITVFLDPFTIPYIQGLDSAIFQQDNTRPQFATVTLQFLQEANIQICRYFVFKYNIRQVMHS